MFIAFLFLFFRPPRLVWLTLTLAFSFSPLSPSRAAADDAVILRVAVEIDVTRMIIGASSDASVSDLSGKRLLTLEGPQTRLRPRQQKSTRPPRHLRPSRLDRPRTQPVDLHQPPMVPRPHAPRRQRQPHHRR